MRPSLRSISSYQDGRAGSDLSYLLFMYQLEINASYGGMHASHSPFILALTF